MRRQEQRTPTTIRCAAYIRTNSVPGGPDEFNTQARQREAIRAFIAGQEPKGWTCLPEPYEDIDYSAGNLRRPALQRLIADMKAGKIDCVVVYSLDRLTRSHSDQARLAAIFRRFRVPVVMAIRPVVTLEEAVATIQDLGGLDRVKQLLSSMKEAQSAMDRLGGIENAEALIQAVEALKNV